jgi:hypothetical protein
LCLDGRVWFSFLREDSHTRYAFTPNVERERWEPAAADARIGTDLNGWLPSAPRFGWASSSGWWGVPQDQPISHADITVKLASKENAIGVAPAPAAFDDFVTGILRAKLRPFRNGCPAGIPRAEHHLGGY